MRHTMKEQVLLGTRIPAPLKDQLSSYCTRHGVKASFFVAEAIRERLAEVAEDAYDVTVGEERLMTAEFLSQQDFENTLRRNKM